MKAVLVSCKPEHCENIASSRKTIEVRKTCPNLDTPFKVYIYCTSVKNMSLSEYVAIHKRTGGQIDDWHGKVIGEYVCDRIEREDYRIQEPEEATSWQDCYEGYDSVFVNADQHYLTKEELYAYGNRKSLYGWHISDLVIYDKPKELSEFNTYCKGYGNKKDKRCKNCPHLYFDNDNINEYHIWCGVHKRKPLTRPPRSWCYVEKLK